MPTYAYAAVLRDKKGDLKQSLNHCYAASQQEARGIAHEHFEDAYPEAKIASLLIREISLEETQLETERLQPHNYENTRVKSEFSLPDKLS